MPQIEQGASCTGAMRSYRSVPAVSRAAALWIS